jgi:hypothetical protein
MPKSRDPHTLPTADEVRALLDYEPGTGVLRWKQRPGLSGAVKIWNAKHAGRSAGSKRRDGYWQVSICDRLFLAHHLAWAIMTGAWPEMNIDHKDTDRANNCWANLRQASGTQNQGNRRINRNNKTGFKGVHRKRKDGRFVAQLQMKGRVVQLGRFLCPNDAHAAYIHAAQRYFGHEFARAS